MSTSSPPTHQNVSDSVASPPPPHDHAAAAPPHEPARLGTVLGDVAIRVLAWVIRLGAATLVIVALAGIGAGGLSLTGRLASKSAAAIQEWSLRTGVSVAVVTMVFAAARSGAIERRRRVARTRFREAAERARLEAYHQREAARAAEAATPGDQAA